MRLVELAERTRLPVSTVFRLLKTLESGGYVEQLPDGAFRPGPAVLTLGFAALGGLDILEVADPWAKRLAEETEAIVNLGVLVGGEVVLLLHSRSRDVYSQLLQVGSSQSAACGSMGKVLLAYLPAAELKKRLNQIDFSTCRGPKRKRTVAELIPELQQVRENGWAVQDREFDTETVSLAMPIRDRTATVVAAMGIVGRAGKWTSARFAREHRNQLTEATLEVSKRLGYDKHPAEVRER